MKTLMRLAVLVAAFVISARGSTLRADYYEDYPDFSDPHTVKSTYVVTPELDGYVDIWLPSRFKVCVEISDPERKLGSRSVTVYIGGLGSITASGDYPSFLTYESSTGEMSYHMSISPDWGDETWRRELVWARVEVKVMFFYQRHW